MKSSGCDSSLDLSVKPSKRILSSASDELLRENKTNTRTSDALVSLRFLAPSSSEDFFFNSWSKFFNYETSRVTSTTRADRRRRRRRRDLPKSRPTRLRRPSRASAVGKRPIDSTHTFPPSPRVSSLARVLARVMTDPRRRDAMERRISTRHRFRLHAARERRRAPPDEFARKFCSTERRGQNAREPVVSRESRQSFDWKNARKTPPARWTRERRPRRRSTRPRRVDDQR